MQCVIVVFRFHVEPDIRVFTDLAPLCLRTEQVLPETNEGCSAGALSGKVLGANIVTLKNYNR